MYSDILIDEHLQIISDELGELSRHHRSAERELTQLAATFLKLETESGLIVSVSLHDVSEIIDENIETLDMMHSSLTAARRMYKLRHYVSRIFRQATTTPSLDAFPVLPIPNSI